MTLATLSVQLKNFRREAGLRYEALRRTLRSQEGSLIFFCAPLGAAVGVVVFVLREAIYALHDIGFNLQVGSYLSAQTDIDINRLVVLPIVGGLLFGILTYFVRKHRSPNIVDPVEANALFGGRMSITDSIRLTIATMISNTAGASVGMEAGYTQIGSAMFSSFAQFFKLRREDARIFVTAGSAAAIAAAFNAPLAGAFYGFELILGTYTQRALAPVAVAALAATIVVRIFGGDAPLFAVTQSFHITPFVYGLFIIVGITAAGFAILTMRAVTLAERILHSVPIWLRPAIGGAALTLLAMGSPQILGSGHGAIQYQLEHSRSFLLITALLFGKLVASAISLGAGFRGGMFSSALFLGVLLGGSLIYAMAFIAPDLASHEVAFMLVGMGAVGAAIVGAPITMVLLVLEGTGNFQITMGVLVAVIIASTIVRLTFGFSFSTWRFHLRGLPIAGAQDIGWIDDLIVGRMMRADPVTVPLGMSLTDLRKQIPLGASKRVFAIGENGRYCGMIDMVTAHDPELTDAAVGLVVGDLVEEPDFYLLRDENVRTALKRFEATKTETLPVLDDRENRQVVGFLSEFYAFRRYTQELERQRGVEMGREDLFPLGPTKAS